MRQFKGYLVHFDTSEQCVTYHIGVSIVKDPHPPIPSPKIKSTLQVYNQKMRFKVRVNSYVKPNSHFLISLCRKNITIVGLFIGSMAPYPTVQCFQELFFFLLKVIVTEVIHL